MKPTKQPAAAAAPAQQTRLRFGAWGSVPVSVLGPLCSVPPWLPQLPPQCCLLSHLPAVRILGRTVNHQAAGRRSCCKKEGLRLWRIRWCSRSHLLPVRTSGRTASPRADSPRTCYKTQQPLSVVDKTSKVSATAPAMDCALLSLSVCRQSKPKYPARTTSDITTGSPCGVVDLDSTAEHRLSGS